MAVCDYEIVHKRGSQNTNADALSRIGSIGKVKEGWTSLMRIQKKTRFFTSFIIPPQVVIGE